VRSESFSETAELDLDYLPTHGTGHWSDYPFGVAVKLEQAGHRLRGANLLVWGEVPVGAGLSSSAAIEVATAYALMDLSGHPIDREEMARICQKAENEFVGGKCGIMDQFISLHGRKGHALMLDCRSLEYELIPIPNDIALVMCNTMVKHSVASGEYNNRRAECEEAVNRLSAVLPNLHALREMNLEQLEQYRPLLSETLWHRAYHVVSENSRVPKAAAALRSGGLAEVGEIMAESHKSLRDFYEVSCPELDLMVELATRQKGIYGARMTGGGFGGCTINLVDTSHADTFRREISRAYEKSTGIHPETYACSAAGAAGPIDLSD